MSAQNGHRFGHNFSSACSAYFKILENTSFLAPSKNTRISYVTTMNICLFNFDYTIHIDKEVVEAMDFD